MTQQEGKLQGEKAEAITLVGKLTGTGIRNAVLYTAQSLTEAQQEQARANIGAGTPYTLQEASPDALGGIKADAAEAADTQPVRIGGDGKLYTAPGGSGDAVLYTAQSLTEAQQAQARANIGAGTPYTLPEASSDALGGIKADAAEETDTQPVRIGGDGKLYTAPGGGGADISLGISGATAGKVAKIKTVNESGAPTAWEAGDAASGGGTNGEKIVEIANGVDVSTVSSFSYSTDMDGNPLKANRFSIMLNAPNATKDDAWVEMTVNGITVLRMYYYKNKKINLRTIIHPTYCEHILYLSAINGLNGAYVGSNESQYGVLRFVGAIDQDLTKAEKTIILKYNHGINDPTWGDNAKLWMWGE